MSQRELAPLADVNNREAAMARCIGPLMTLATVMQVDETRKNMSQMERKIPGYFPSTGTSQHMASSKLVRANHLIEDVAPGHATVFERIAPSASQIEHFSKYTFQQQPGMLMHETYSAQAILTGELALPAYYSCKDNRLQPYSIAEMHTTMKQIDFKELLVSLAIGCNGVYRQFIRTHEAGVPNHVDMLNIPVSFSHGVESLLPSAINIEDVCVMTKDGIKVSPAMVRALGSLMRLDNQTGFINIGSRTEGSTGCPARRKYSKNRPDDFTDNQWGLLTNGDNPIATYDATIQRLEILRNPIAEYNDLLADTLELAVKQ